MSVFRDIASRVYQGWSRFFLRLRRPSDRATGSSGHTSGNYGLRQRISKSCSPWVNNAQRFFPPRDARVDSNYNKNAASASHRASAGLDSERDAHFPRQASTQVGKLSGNGRVDADESLHARSAMHRPHHRRSTGHSLLQSAKGTAAHRTRTVTLLAILLLATCLGQRFYRQPGLDIRSISPQTFYAPASAVVEDSRATESRRDDVRNGSVQVLKIDLEQTAAARESLETLLLQGNELRDQAGRPNFLNLETLSQSTQDFLFQASDDQWQTTWRLAKLESLSVEQLLTDSEAAESPDDVQSPDSSEAQNAEGAAAQPPPSPLPAKLAAQVAALSAEQKASLQELLAYRELSSPKGLSMLQTRMATRRGQYRRAYEDLVAAASTEDQPLYNYHLFELSESEWISLTRDTKTIFEQMMLQGINVGTPEYLLRQAIEARIPPDSSDTTKKLMVDLLAVSLLPNLVPDEERTWEQAEQAVRQIDPVMVSVEEGEVIVRADDIIGSSEFVLLDHFGLTDRYFNWVGLCGFSVLIGVAVAFYLWVDHRQLNQLNQRDHFLVLLLCLVVSMLALLKVPTLGLPAVGLLVGSFYGPALGITVLALLTLVLPIGTAVDTVPLISGSVAAMLGTVIASRLRSREEFALLGGVVGLAQAIVHLLLTLMRFTVATPLWQSVFVGSALHGLYGIAWSVVALGVSPYLEHFFDVVTPIRLAELSNPNRPLLKRLAAEAPGTFQHTMFVANLAEAAARALGRNVELVRAGTLYHDIGKMHEPQGFIENQMGGPNMHDELNDPWESASIIKKHVTQGLVM
ncbi:MAG: HDIG domain-containing metalloprotein, partial [Cyanobacteria bacterium J06632_3]